MTQHSWPAIVLARACDGPARIPFLLDDEPGPVLGSVAIHHLEALRAWPDAFELRCAPDGAPRARWCCACPRTSVTRAWRWCMRACAGTG